MNATKILLAISAIFFLTVLSRMSFHFRPNPYIDTIFANDFTLKNWDKVTSEMSREQVTYFLGQPLHKTGYGDQTDPERCWLYSTDGKAQPFDFSWFRFQICFPNGLSNVKSIQEFYD